jgi:hypothetical protein
MNKKKALSLSHEDYPTIGESREDFSKHDLLPNDGPPFDLLVQDDLPQEDSSDNSSDLLQDNEFESNQMDIEQPSSTIIPSIHVLRKTLVAMFSTVYSQGWFLDQIGSDTLWLLQNRYTNFKPVGIAPHLYLYPYDFRNSVSKSHCLVYSL